MERCSNPTTTMAPRYLHRSRLVFIAVTILSLLTSSVSSNINTGAENHVLTLDHSNFSQAASDHNFLVVQFYAPCEKVHKLLCKYVEKLAPEVGIFPIFSGEEFENFKVVAKELLFELWDYDVFHTMDASLLPRGESYVTTPTLRLLKPYDELFVDSKNFQVFDMKNFIIEASIPLVTDNNTPDNIMHWLSQLSDEQVTLFLDFDNEHFNDFKCKFHNVAALYKGKGLWFYLADPRTNEDVFKYDGLRFDQLPVIIIYNNYGSSYMKSNLKPGDISPWLNDYKDGKLKPYLKSQPIPETNNEPLKVVVADSLQDMVLNSKNNVLLDIDVPSCGQFLNFAPFIPELAVFFEDNDDVMVARLDGTTNDIPKDMFDIINCYMLYFKSANGTLLSYDGEATKEDIITFIGNNRPIQNKYFLHQSAESVTLDG